MLEVFFFQKRDNLEDKINQVKQELYYGDSDSDEDEEIPENTIVENNEFIESSCKCAVCTCINNIYTRWESWTPETHMHNVLKEKLDNWDNLL